MNAQELRIGNYINVPVKNQCPFKIDGFEYLTKDDCKVEMTIKQNFHPLTWWLKDLSPISISEEWLLKAGFKEKMSNVYQYNGFELTTDDGLIDNGYSIINGLNPVKYVHQLQNLYFALTSQELTFNL